MDYDQFDAAYGEFIDNVRSLDEAARTSEVDRLRRSVDTVEPAIDQEAARLLVMSLDDALSTPAPRFVPAAEVFANAIGRRSGLGGQEVLGRLALVNTEDKFRVAAELVYQASDLPQLIPQSHHGQAVERIMGSMMQPFDRIEGMATDDPAGTGISPLAGSAADREGHQQVRDLTTFWSTRQDLRQSLDLGITGSPQLSSSSRPRSATGQGQESGGVPSTGGRRLSRRNQANCRPVE